MKLISTCYYVVLISFLGFACKKPNVPRALTKDVDDGGAAQGGAITGKFTISVPVMGELKRGVYAYNLNLSGPQPTFTSTVIEGGTLYNQNQKPIFKPDANVPLTPIPNNGEMIYTSPPNSQQKTLQIVVVNNQVKSISYFGYNAELDFTMGGQIGGSMNSSLGGLGGTPNSTGSLPTGVGGSTTGFPQQPPYPTGPTTPQIPSQWNPQGTLTPGPQSPGTLAPMPTQPFPVLTP